VGEIRLGRTKPTALHAPLPEIAFRKLFHLTAKPRKYGQTTIPTMIFHQIRLAKAIVNNQPINQIPPTIPPTARPSLFLLSCAIFLSFQ
jgi:hypothetical protein